MIIGYSLGKSIFDVESYLRETNNNDISLIDKTGPSKLFHCSQNEDSLTLGLEALDNLFSGANINKDNIEMLISVSESPRLFFPGNSSYYLSKLDLSTNLHLLDINAGCTGFVDAISIASSMKLKSLIICSETYSKHNSTKSRSTACLFSDAASAIYYDPSEYEILYDKTIVKKNTFETLYADSSGLFMNGAEVFQFFSSTVVNMIKDAVEKFPSIKFIYPHQGSKLIIDVLKNKFSDHNVQNNIVDKGNSVSATIPILLKDKEFQGVNDEPIILVGFGVGLQSHLIVLRKKINA